MEEHRMHLDEVALAREADTLREEATRLLAHARVLERLGQYGEVGVGGSYRWDLMSRCDIDCYVVNPTCDLELALGALTRFIRDGDFHGFAFIDAVRHSVGSLPVGFLVGMARRFGEREWRVEAWFSRAPLPSQDWIEARMTEEARRAILRLKHQRDSARLPIASYDIYRAVLLGGVRDLEQVEGWLSGQARR